MSKTDNIFEASFYFYVSNYNFNEEILYKAKSYIFNYFIRAGQYNKYIDYNIDSYFQTVYVYFIFLSV